MKHGKVYDHLGMILDYSKEGTVQVTMNNYIKKMLAELGVPNNKDGVAANPAAEHLFQTNPKPVLLGKDRADLFHHSVA